MNSITVRNAQYSMTIGSALVAILALGCGDDSSRATGLSPLDEDGGMPAPRYEPGPTEAEPDSSPGPFAESDAGADGAAEDRPFSHAFEGLISQPVPWAGIEVSIAAARYERGMEERISPPDATYAVLELDLTNRTRRDTSFLGRDTWDLLLADGERVPLANYVSFDVPPMATITEKLFYPFSEERRFEGASLVLEGVERGALEPEVVPLDAVWERRYPLRIESLIGTKIEPPEEAGKRVKYEVIDARVDLNDPESGRASYGMKFVRLETVVTGLSEYSFYVNEDNHRAIVDGRSYAPANQFTDNLAENASGDLTIVFEVPAETVELEVSFVASSAGDTATFPINLETDAVFVEE